LTKSGQQEARMGGPPSRQHVDALAIDRVHPFEPLSTDFDRI